VEVEGLCICEHGVNGSKTIGYVLSHNSRLYDESFHLEKVISGRAAMQCLRICFNTLLLASTGRMLLHGSFRKLDYHDGGLFLYSKEQKKNATKGVSFTARRDVEKYSGMIHKGVRCAAAVG